MKEIIVDFCFFLACGIFYILLQYVMLDGVFRIYFFAFFILGFLISKKSVGALISSVLDFLLNMIYKPISAFVWLVFLPVRVAFSFAKRLISPLISKVAKYVCAQENRARIKREIKRLNAFINEI